MNILNERPGLVAIGTFVAGLFIGLFVLGWWLWPVEWSGAGPAQLAEADQANYLVALADSFAVRGNAETVQSSLSGWPEANTAICNLAAAQTDPSSIANLNNLALANGGQPCGAPQQLKASNRQLMELREQQQKSQAVLGARFSCCCC